MRYRNPIPLLRALGMIEAVSFLALLFIAMPLKYLGGMPMPVKVVGWTHGVLFVAFCAALLWTMLTARWPIGRAALIFVAALLPFGPFVVDRRMKGYAAEFRERMEGVPVAASQAGPLNG
jgi:integral membrane protein